MDEQKIKKTANKSTEFTQRFFKLKMVKYKVWC